MATTCRRSRLLWVNSGASSSNCLPTAPPLRSCRPVRLRSGRGFARDMILAVSAGRVCCAHRLVIPAEAGIQTPVPIAERNEKRRKKEGGKRDRSFFSVSFILFGKSASYDFQITKSTKAPARPPAAAKAYARRDAEAQRKNPAEAPADLCVPASRRENIILVRSVTYVAPSAKSAQENKI
jgi:hypothetical protein